MRRRARTDPRRGRSAMIVPTATKTNLGAGHNAEPVIEILSDGLPVRTNIPAKVPFCEHAVEMVCAGRSPFV
jgi:hypothetical protein